MTGTRTTHILAGIAGALLMLAASVAALWLLPKGLQYLSLYERAAQMERIVAVSWGDGAYGKAFYGAYVYYQPRKDDRLNVLLSVRIGRGDLLNHHAHDPKLLGVVKTPEEAVARWGTVTWTDQGLTVGSAREPGFVFPKESLERHR